MDVRLCEWVNVNRNARLVEKSIKGKKSQPGQPPECVYLLQIVGKINSAQQSGGSSQSQLACLCSNQVIKLYDQQSLKFVREIVKPHGSNNGKRCDTNEIGFFKQPGSSMLFSCGDDGCLKCWDLRANTSGQAPKPAICFDYSADPRAFLGADISAQDLILGAGTSKSIDDSFVYLFDVRYGGNTYLHKLRESHSDDVTQIKFDPTKESRFCSASVDGLVCLYDLNQPLEEQHRQQQQKQIKTDNKNADQSDNESDHENGNDQDDEDDDDDDGPSDPDLIEQVFNASSQVQKIGFLSSKGGAVASPSDQVYAITFVNELVIWDLTTHDQVYRSQANPMMTTNPEANLANDVLRTPEEAPEEDEFYFFDSFYLPPSSQQQQGSAVLVKAIGDKRGRMTFVDCKPNGRVLFETKESQDLDADDHGQNKLTRTSHRDIIRSSYWNAEAGSYFTAGEDGFIFKWQMGPTVGPSQPDPKRKIAEPINLNPSKRPNKEENPSQSSPSHSKESNSVQQAKNIYFDRKYFN